MGIVLRARDLETGELIALKILKQRIAAEGPEMERFKEELRLARKVTHKNVCRVYEFHRIGGLPCISMEYVQGESLRTCLRSRGRLEPSIAIRIAKHLCGGLREAHKGSYIET